MTLRNFRYLAVTEAISFLLLLGVAVPLKATGVTEWGVHIMGSVHGLLFIAYLAFATSLMKPAGWSYLQTFWILVAAMIPFGGFVVDWWILKNEPVPT
jgi:integral membrane protein